MRIKTAARDARGARGTHRVPGRTASAAGRRPAGGGAPAACLGYVAYFYTQESKSVNGNGSTDNAHCADRCVYYSSPFMHHSSCVYAALPWRGHPLSDASERIGSRERERTINET